MDIPSEHLVPEFGSIFTCSNDQIMITVKKTAQSAGLGGLYLYRHSGVFKSQEIVKWQGVCLHDACGGGRCALIGGIPHIVCVHIQIAGLELQRRRTICGMIQTRC